MYFNICVGVWSMRTPHGSRKGVSPRHVRWGWGKGVFRKMPWGDEIWLWGDEPQQVPPGGRLLRSLWWKARAGMWGTVFLGRGERLPRLWALGPPDAMLGGRCPSQHGRRLRDRVLRNMERGVRAVCGCHHRQPCHCHTSRVRVWVWDYVWV